MARRYLLGFDVGSSSVKASLTDVDRGEIVASAFYPDHDQVFGNLLFLGCLASMICFLTWNWCISKLGTVKATNWVYFNPITTMIFASWVLGEQITPYFLAGAACILIGMYVADKKTKGEQ